MTIYLNVGQSSKREKVREGQRNNCLSLMLQVVALQQLLSQAAATDQALAE